MLTVSREWPFVHWAHETAGAKTAGWMALALSIVCGATFTPFAKSLTGTLSPLSMLFISEVLTLLFVSFSFGFLPMLRQIVCIDRKTMSSLLAMCLLNGIAGPYLWFAGLRATSAVNAIFYSRIELIFLLLLAALYIHERVTRRHVFASAVILFGAIVIALRGFSDGVNFWIGDAAVIAAAFCYSLGSSIFRRRLAHLKPQLVVLSRAIVAVSFFFMISPFVEHPFIAELRSFPISLMPMLVSFALVSRFLNTFTFYEAAEHLPLSTIYPVAMLEIIASAALAAVVLGEPLLWYHVVGGALILAGNMALITLGVHEDNQHLEQHAVERLAHRAA